MFCSWFPLLMRQRRAVQCYFGPVQTQSMMLKSISIMSICTSCKIGFRATR